MGQDRWPSQCATAATANAVAMTSSTASVPIERASRRNPVGDDVTAVVDKEGEQSQQYQIGVEGYVRHKRQEADYQPGHDQYYRRRDPRSAEDGNANQRH